MQKYGGLHKLRIFVQLKNKWTFCINWQLQECVHKIKKISSIGAHYQHCWAPLILSTSKRIESATTFILSKGTTQHFWITMNEWRATWENMKASLQILMYFQCIFLLSAISKNLVVAALKGKTSMVLSLQNWQLDTPEGKNWYIQQCWAIVVFWYFKMLSQTWCQNVCVFLFFFVSVSTIWFSQVLVLSPQNW